MNKPFDGWLRLAEVQARTQDKHGHFVVAFLRLAYPWIGNAPYGCRQTINAIYRYRDSGCLHEHRVLHPGRISVP